MAGLLVTAQQTILPIPHATTRPPVIRAEWLITRRPWAMTADALSGLLAIATRARLAPADLTALESQLGRPLANTHVVTVRDGIATIPVDGPLFRRADMFSKISGATDLETLALDLTTAKLEPSVRGILLHINSPGGEVDGVHELAAMIRDASQVKPVEAYIAGTGASAAYWLASAAEKITLDATAWAGNIGVIAFIPKADGPGADGEREYVRFVATRSPRKRPDPVTIDGAEQIQSVIDQVADVFIADAARYRGMSEDELVAAGDDGWVRIGQAAVEHGLADAVGSYESTLAALAERTGPAPPDTPTTITIQPVNRAAPAARSVTTTASGAVARGFLARQGGIMAQNETTGIYDAVQGSTAAPDDPVNMGTAVVELSTIQDDSAPRIAELEAQLATLRAEREIQDRRISDLQAAQDRLEAERLRERAQVEVAGHFNQGIPWRGEEKANAQRYVRYAQAFGEQSEDFQAFVARERETALTFATSDIMREHGSGAAPPALGDAQAALEGRARAAMEKNPRLTYDQAMAEAMDADPDLMARFDQETKDRPPAPKFRAPNQGYRRG